MVTMIGLVTMIALVWVIASSMERESEAEKRRVGRLSGAELLPTLTDVRKAAKAA